MAQPSGQPQEAPNSLLKVVSTQKLECLNSYYTKKLLPEKNNNVKQD